ncbi:hypothetical protein NC651_029428 [Populus alba x Populus x berolinensis]|nr:hypothetical protein NC651_029428 [Populus alba x Populus x berolinensis]
MQISVEKDIKIASREELHFLLTVEESLYAPQFITFFHLTLKADGRLVVQRSTVFHMRWMSPGLQFDMFLTGHDHVLSQKRAILGFPAEKSFLRCNSLKIDWICWPAWAFSGAVLQNHPH